MRAAQPQSSCLRLSVENYSLTSATLAELHHPERDAVEAEHVPALERDPEVSPAACHQVLSMGRGIEPELERVPRGAELSLSPREILAERAGRQVAGLLERARERHPAGCVREAAPPHSVGLQE